RQGSLSCAGKLQCASYRLTSKHSKTSREVFDRYRVLAVGLRRRRIGKDQKQWCSIERLRIATQRFSSSIGTNSPVRCATRMSPGPKTTASAPSAIMLGASVPKATVPDGLFDDSSRK